MIVSHAHRYVFVPIPKTGTHAVRQALREHMGPDDIEQVGLFVNRKFPWPELAALANELQATWPPLISGIHRLYLAGGRVILTLVFGDAVESGQVLVVVA